MFGYATFAQVTFAQAPDYDVAEATATAATVIGPGAGYGSWARKKLRKPIEGRVRLLSELDPPLFTPEEILEAPPAYNVDEKTRAQVEKIALEAFAEAAKQKLLLARERELVDDEELFLLM